MKSVVLFVLIACGVSAKDITIIKSSEKFVVENVDENQNLQDFRIRLTPRIITADSPTERWRFFDDSPSEKPKTHYYDWLIPDRFENFIKLSKILNGRNHITVINTEADNPDYRGTVVDWFLSKYAQIRVRRNDEESSDKFHPIMLTDVMPINPRVEENNRHDPMKNVISIQNAVICQEDTPIIFDIQMEKYRAFGFSITPRSGDAIVEKLYYTNREYTCQSVASIGRFQKHKSQIRIHSTEHSGRSRNERIARRQYTVKLWKVNEYRININSYDVDNECTPGYGFVAYSPGYGQTAVIGNSFITSGTASEGGISDEKFGEIHVLREDLNDILGQITIDFFVFRSESEAKEYFLAQNITL